jgi:hypothetical protein
MAAFRRSLPGVDVDIDDRSVVPELLRGCGGPVVFACYGGVVVTFLPQRL